MFAVVMGVSGVGKTTVGELLAEELGWAFADADEFHSPANIAKMEAGIALADADRWPWLDDIAGQIHAWRSEGTHGVVSCSALRRVYRERLVAGHTDVRFVHLVVPTEHVAQRLAERRGHFMPLDLLESQFDALEPPGEADAAPALTLDALALPGALVETAAEWLRAESARYAEER